MSEVPRQLADRRDDGEDTPDRPVVDLVPTSERPPSTDSPSRRRLAVAATVIIGAFLVSYAANERPEDASAVRTSRDERPATTSVAPSPTTDATAPVIPGGAGSGDGAGPPPGTTTTTGPLTATAYTEAPAPPPPPPAPSTTGSPPPPAAVVARPVPSAGPSNPAPIGPAPAWTSGRTAGSYLGTDVGCASGTSAGALDVFFRDRIGPAIGLDYQHVYDLGGDRRLWLFQDTFLDHGGTATSLDQASFAHNTAMVQRGACFTLLHRGSAAAPTSFEPGTGEQILSRWFWPLGGEMIDGQLRVFWAEMSKTADPQTPDGLGWIPVRTWIGTYDTSTLARLEFRPAPNSGVAPIYGFAVSSDADHTYLFGNTFDQNLARQGGYHACPCSATSMSLARVPRGRLDVAPEYRTATGWSSDPGEAQPYSSRFHAENPMQPRYLGDQWVAATKVDGYWGDELAIDVALQPWGPWTTVSRRRLAPRRDDPFMNTYHAHLMPWLSDGSLVVSVSQNARDMLRDAWPHPERYRLQFLGAALVTPPPLPPLEPSPTTTVTTPTTPATTTPVTEPPTSETSTTAPPDTVASTTTTQPCGPTTTSSSTTSTTPTSTSSSTTTTTDPCASPP